MIGYKPFSVPPVMGRFVGFADWEEIFVGCIVSPGGVVGEVSVHNSVDPDDCAIRLKVIFASVPLPLYPDDSDAVMARLPLPSGVASTDEKVLSEAMLLYSRNSVLYVRPILAVDILCPSVSIFNWKVTSSPRLRVPVGATRE